MKCAWFILLVVALSASSCKDTWDEDDKAQFKRVCYEDAIKWAGTDRLATQYCDCVMEKILVKYPNENDALENVDSIIKDPQLIGCRPGAANR